MLPKHLVGETALFHVWLVCKLFVKTDELYSEGKICETIIENAWGHSGECVPSYNLSECFSFIFIIPDRDITNFRFHAECFSFQTFCTSFIFAHVK